METYENVKYGFKLEYPANWRVDDRGIGWDVGLHGLLHLAFRSPENKKLIDQAQAKIDAKIGDYGSADVYYFNNDIEIAIFNKNPISDNDMVDVIIGKITLNGKKATEYWMGGYGSNYGLIVENNGISFQFDFKSCGTDECIKNRELSSNVKQILYSFEFTK